VPSDRSKSAQTGYYSLTASTECELTGAGAEPPCYFDSHVAPLTSGRITTAPCSLLQDPNGTQNPPKHGILMPKYQKNVWVGG